MARRFRAPLASKLNESCARHVKAPGRNADSPVSAKIATSMKATVEEVEKDPHEYLHRVLEGETVVLFREEQPVAEIRPLRKRTGLRPIGLAKGDFVVPDDFDDPLPDDVLDLFEGK